MSPPPPNQCFVVTRKRVLKCAAGTRGLRRCATREIPVAKKRGSSSAPAICLRNSGENSPCTVETLTPTFSKTRPRISPMRRRRPRAASRGSARTGRVACRHAGRWPGRPRSLRRLAQILSRSASNQAARPGARRRRVVAAGPLASVIVSSCSAWVLSRFQWIAMLRALPLYAARRVRVAQVGPCPTPTPRTTSIAFGPRRSRPGTQAWPRSGTMRHGR